MREPKDLPVEAVFLVGFLLGALVAGGGLTAAEIGAVSEVVCEPVTDAPVRPDE